MGTSGAGFSSNEENEIEMFLAKPSRWSWDMSARRETEPANSAICRVGFIWA